MESTSFAVASFVVLLSFDDFVVVITVDFVFVVVAINIDYYIGIMIPSTSVVDVVSVAVACSQISSLCPNINV